MHSPRSTRSTCLALMLMALSPSLVSCMTDTRPGPAALPAALQPGEHRATLRGVQLFYRVAGSWDGRSAPVVFLAGGPGGHGYAFSRTAGALLERSQLMVYFDQRGTGRSERPASGDYALATMVDDIEALRVHLGVPKLALIGHSFGGVLALEYGARYPDRLAAAVLAAPLWNAPMACREGLARLAATRPEAHRQVVAGGEIADDQVCGRVFSAIPAPEREAFFRQNMFPNPATLARQKALDEESGLPNTREMSAALFRNGLLAYQFAGASRLRAPVLVVSGARDFQSGPKTLRNLAQALPSGRLLEYPTYGHWMFIDDADRFAADVDGFLRSAQH